MFRDTSGSPMNEKMFGVGSIIIGDGSEKWLVVGTAERDAMLVDLKSMKMVGSPVSVVDINAMSSGEARELCSMTGKHWTFSDFDLDAKGLKFST